METKDVILELRTKRGLSQDGLAGKVMVTRQAVSRWENGETVPNTDTLKLLSSWNVSLVETDVLGSWRIWILY
ncbi:MULTISPECIES: helix-turn-helix transcriptional regulator [Coprococcus]|uniref:helix-turn-helix transcriptional regulator n=1 Tax=Coprococcus TaxID=33042 RepID=UPI001FA8633F|nr:MULTISPECIES: helix-turn-helix transcriptional regulator [Coprococcus]